jgi:spore coat protein U-like protein
MKHGFLKGTALALMSLGACTAHAVYTCTVTGSPLTVVYPQGTVLNASSQITVTCTRAATDPASTTYSVGIDQGDPPAGRNYSQVVGATTQTLNYQIYREVTYTTTWNNSSRRVTGTLNFGSALVTSFTLPYYLRIASQTGKPAGLYQDVGVTYFVRVPQTGGVRGQGDVPLNALISPSCSLTVPPSNLTLTYPSFAAAPVSAATNFSVLCTNLTPYTMALSPSAGTIAGVNYSLSLSASSFTATGTNNNHSITATAPPGQSGTCGTGACSGSQLHTLTITY